MEQYLTIALMPPVLSCPVAQSEFLYNGHHDDGSVCIEVSSTDEQQWQKIRDEFFSKKKWTFLLKTVEEQKRRHQ